MAYHPHGIDNDPLIADALNRIYADFGATVSVKNKAKSLLKFGRNSAVNTASTGYTLWNTGTDQANETYVAANTNSIDSISSSTVADTSKTFVVEGHTESGGNKTFVSQSVTTDASSGRTRVALTTALNRVTRAYNSGSSAATGPIYFYENTSLTNGKPTDTTKIHLTIASGRNQSEKASTSLSSSDYWIITNYYADMLTKTANTLADVQLQIRLNGKLYRQQANLSTSSGIHGQAIFNPYLIAPANSDIRLIAVGSGACDVSGGIQGFLAN